MNSILILKSVSLALLVSGSAQVQALIPDGGTAHQPGSPFTVQQQTPTRHVGKGGTRLQSDPYGMPSYGRLQDNAFSLHNEQGFTAVADFRGPSQRPPASDDDDSFRRQRTARESFGQRTARESFGQRTASESFRRQRAGPSQQSFRREDRRTSAPPPPQEPEIPEFERHSYFRIKEDFGRGRGPGRKSPDEEEFFFAGRGPSYQNHHHQHHQHGGFEQGGMPAFFQEHDPMAPAFFVGRPSSSFHNRPVQPDFNGRGPRSQFLY